MINNDLCVRLSRSGLLAGVASISLFLSFPIASANAQDVSPARKEQSSGIEEVIVTAEKRAQNINDVPASIQALTGDQLATAGVTDISAINLVAPGVTYAKSSQNTPVLSMRGIGFNSPNVSSTSPVGVYVDEVSYAYPYMASGPIFDIDRVEVLKGPQGTLYGRNTTGGLINFITALPGSHLEFGGNTEIGNYGTHNFDAYVSGPVTSTLGIRVAGRYERSDDGWQHNIVDGSTLGRKNDGAARMTVLWKPGADFTDTLMASYWFNKSDTVAPQAILYTPQNPDFANPGLAAQVHANWKNTDAGWDVGATDEPAFKTNSSFWSVSNKASWDINDNLSLTSLTAYNFLQRNDMTDVDGTSIEAFSLNSYGHIGSLSQELRLTGQVRDIKYIVGGYYSKDFIIEDQVGYYDQTSTNNLLKFVASQLVDPTNQLYSPQQYATGFNQYRNISHQSSRSASGFADIDVPLTSAWSVTGGVRYSDDLFRFGTCSADYNGITLPIWNTSVTAKAGLAPNSLHVQPNGCMDLTANETALAPFEQPSLDETSVAWRAGTSYKFTPEHMAYITVSRGYKSAAVPILPATTVAQDAPAKQERVTNYEIGTKDSFFNHRVQIDMAAFYDSYGNKQEFGAVLDPIFTSLPRLINIPKSEVKGAELQLTWKLSPGLTYTLGGTYARSNITSYTGFDPLGAPRNYEGTSFADSPKWQESTSLTYETDIGADLGFRGGVNVAHQTKSYSFIGNDNRFAVKAYTLVNLDLSLYSFTNGWSVGLWGRNVFNENYWTEVTYETDTIYRTPAMPATYGMRLGYTF